MIISNMDDKFFIKEGIEEYELDDTVIKKREREKVNNEDRRKEEKIKRIKQKIRRLEKEIEEYELNSVKMELSDIHKIISEKKFLQEYRKLNKIQKEEIKELYGEYLFRKIKGVGVLREKLLEFLKEEPDRKENEILNFIEDIAETYFLDFDKIKEKMKPILKRYFKRRKEIKEIDISMFLDYFYKVFIDIDEVSISKNIFDVSLSGGVYKINDDGEYVKREEDGGFIYKNDPITVNYDGSEKTNMHEEQHHIQAILAESGKFNSEKMDDALSAARDEILACYREDDINTERLIPWFYDERHKIDEDRVYSKIWKKLPLEFRREYAEHVKKSQFILSFLQDKVFLSKEEVIGVLQDIPLDKWSVVRKRLLKYMKNKDTRMIAGNKENILTVKSLKLISKDLESRDKK